MRDSEGQSLPIIMVNNTNIQPRKDAQQLRYIMQTPSRVAISKNFNGRTGTPIARTLSGPSNITMIPLNAHGPTTKIYRVTHHQQSSNNNITATTRTSNSPNTEAQHPGLPVGSLSRPPAAHSPIQIEIASSRASSSSPEASSMGELSTKRIRNNKDYDNYAPSTFKPGPKPSVDDHLLDERALDRRNRRRASNRQAARKQRDKRLRKIQDYESIIEAITEQRDEAQRKVTVMSAQLHRIVQAHPEVAALINHDQLSIQLDHQDNMPMESIELKKGRVGAARDEFYVAKTELLDDVNDGDNSDLDNRSIGAIVVEHEEDAVTDVIKLEADFDD